MKHLEKADVDIAVATVIKRDKSDKSDKHRAPTLLRKERGGGMVCGTWKEQT